MVNTLVFNIDALQALYAYAKSVLRLDYHHTTFILRLYYVYTKHRDMYV